MACPHTPGPTLYLAPVVQTNHHDIADEPDGLDRVVLQLLTDPETAGVWSEGEVAQALGSDAHAAHALVSLHAAGLIHRIEDFVFATRPAARFVQLERML